MDKLVEEQEIVVDREMAHKVEINSNNKHVVEDLVHVVQIEVISKCLILKKMCEIKKLSSLMEILLERGLA